MGADFFTVHIDADNPDKAFDEARKEALYWHGHSGYTGTIAEKPGYVMCGKADSVDEAEEMAYDIDEACVNATRPEHRYSRLASNYVSDKWGRAGCIETPDGYLFFGWASS